MRNYYDILGVPQTATTVEIKKRWRKLSAKYHPDKTGGNTFMEEWLKYINEAYAFLKDPVKRAAHDAELAAAAANSRPQAFSNASSGVHFDANAFRPIVELLAEGLIKWMMESIANYDGRKGKTPRKKRFRPARTSKLKG
jgi:DnaJ-class molecular chaperone